MDKHRKAQVSEPQTTQQVSQVDMAPFDLTCLLDQMLRLMMHGTKTQVSSVKNVMEVNFVLYNGSSIIFLILATIKHIWTTV